MGFEPIAGSDTRILILGSLPGRRSLQTGQYYAHARNGFWPIMGALFDATGGYDERCRRLVDARIAVWDVLREARRPGSLDSSIRAIDAQTNDFQRFFERNRKVSLIAFNGRKAQSLFDLKVAPLINGRLPRRVVLPSTSPAHAAMSLGEKEAIWRSMLLSTDPYLN